MTAARSPSTGRLAALVLATVVALLLFDAAAPFRLLRLVLTHDGRTYSLIETRIEPKDGIANAELATALHERPPFPPGARGVLVFGNSQLMVAAHSQDGMPDPVGPIDGAAAQLGQMLAERSPGKYAVYNASVPSQNLPEVLWQSIYWFRVEKAPPAAIVLQASYDTFRKTGVRAAFHSLLDDARFARAVDDVVEPDRAYAGEFAVARREHESRRRELAKSDAKKDHESGSVGQPGAEPALRSVLEHVPAYAHRTRTKTDFLEDLYFLRVFVLRVSPSSRRHIAGEPYAANVDALRTTVRLARAAGTKVFVYNAPMNPQTKIYYDEEYAQYLRDLASIAEEEGAVFTDLASAVDASEYGYWVDAPDPIHFQKPGHQRLAARLFEVVAPALEGP